MFTPTFPRRRLAAFGAVLAATASGGAQEAVDFTAVAAIFDERCTVCHSGAAAALGLRLDSYEHVMAGSEDGAVVAPGDPDGSELVRRLEGASLPRMPLTGPPFLDEAQIQVVRDWIEVGAPGPAATPERTRSASRPGPQS